jgi:hypothetical protein
MNIHLSAIFAIAFVFGAAVVIGYCFDFEQEPALSEEDLDRAQHYAMYRESFAILLLCICFVVTAAASALIALTIY